MAQKWLKVGLEERSVRDAKLRTLREKRAAKAAEKARLEAVVLATRYSELVEMGNDALKDQLKKQKVLGKTGFTATQANRTAYILQLQTLLLEADADANDLAEGDSGITGRNIKRKASVRKQTGGGDKKAGKKRKGVHEWMGFEWTDEEADGFEVEAIVGKVIADGVTEYANQGKANKGTVLYRIIWKDKDGTAYPPDMVWYEPRSGLGAELPALVEYEARAAEEAAAAVAEAAEDEELEGLEEEESLPAP